MSNSFDQKNKPNAISRFFNSLYLVNNLDALLIFAAFLSLVTMATLAAVLFSPAALGFLGIAFTALWVPLAITGGVGLLTAIVCLILPDVLNVAWQALEGLIYLGGECYKFVKEWMAELDMSQMKSDAISFEGTYRDRGVSATINNTQQIDVISVVRDNKQNEHQSPKSSSFWFWPWPCSSVESEDDDIFSINFNK